MNNRSCIQLCIAGAAVLALSAIAFAAAQQNPQGQYHLSYSPVAKGGVVSTGSLATYSPIKSVNREEIQLRGDDGVVYTFLLNADTIFCQGSTRVSDWTYLKAVPKKTSITILTTDIVNLRAMIVWDKQPAISVENGQIAFALPPMCK